MLGAMNTRLPAGQTPLRVVVSLDVEEEGLFSGRYARQGCTAENVQTLPALAPLSDELGFPLTLFCSWAVFSDAAACRVLERMRDRHGAEIGCHLHHWSTPPFDEGDALGQDGQPLRTDSLPEGLLRARLERLFSLARGFQAAPVESFRMGRWDCKARLFPLLAELGVRADSSVCPLRAFKGGADHFLAPQTPYWPLGRRVPFLEVPVTQIPVLPALARAWHALGRGRDWIDAFHFAGALSANPFWHGPLAMRVCARLLRLRKGPVLSLFWHSTETAAGRSPHVPDQRSVDRKLACIASFLAWLKAAMPVRGATLGQVFRDAWDDGAGQGRLYPERRDIPGQGDW